MSGKLRINFPIHTHIFLVGFCRKPKNQRVKRALEKREPKIFENDKTAVFIRGGHTSETVTQVLNEMVCFVQLAVRSKVLTSQALAKICSYNVIQLCKVY